MMTRDTMRIEGHGTVEVLWPEPTAGHCVRCTRCGQTWHTHRVTRPDEIGLAVRLDPPPCTEHHFAPDPPFGQTCRVCGWSESRDDRLRYGRSLTCPGRPLRGSEEPA